MANWPTVESEFCVADLQMPTSRVGVGAGGNDG